MITRLPDAIWCPYGPGDVLVRPRTDPAERWILSNTEGGAEPDRLYAITAHSRDQMALDGFSLRRMPYDSVSRDASPSDAT